MRRLLLFIAIALGAMSMANLQARPQGRGRGHNKDERRDEDIHQDVRRARPARDFRPADREAIFRHYDGPRNLPPGLARKLNRGDRLPPSWEKRFRPFPVVLERQPPPPCAGCVRGFIDGCAVVYDRKTRVVFDVFVAFGK